MKRTIQDLAQMSVEPSLSSIMSHCFNPFSSFSWFSFLKQIIQTATATGKDRTNKTLSRLDLIDAHTPQASVLSSIRLLVTTNPESPFEVRARYRTVILAKSFRESEPRHILQVNPSCLFSAVSDDWRNDSFFSNMESIVPRSVCVVLHHQAQIGVLA